MNDFGNHRKWESSTPTDDTAARAPEKHQSRRLTRRALLGAAGAGAVGVVAAPAVLPKVREEILADNILDHFHYLIIDKVDVLRFIDEFETARFSLWRNPLKYTQKMPNTVYTTFLLSTDFFWNNARTDLPIQYQGLASGEFFCNNPFTDGHLSDGEEQLPPRYAGVSA